MGIPLEFRELETFCCRRNDLLSAGQRCTLDACGDGTADEAVEPVVVISIGSKFPLVDGTATSFGFDTEFGDEVLGKELVGDWVTSKQ